ncbi:hypothetical protein LNV08_04380 [Paucibacter sp. TC2R-5]|uniref:hypothetical protein n=1 Tax=Paucibacter sp. TC2R-5 TaxID=2893555 RepID=UPI0021E3BE9B|nr:hypothetical protein [Paucibacter sp. TC2R-5]MCV2358204.1 hypothetical protein [Paucibacter sp. TC2R-5]
MKYTSSIKAAFALAITMTFGTAMAAANAPVEMQRVEIAGQKSADIARFDVQAACPTISQEMKSELTSAFDRYQATGLVKVEFRVQGNQINAVAAHGGPSEYREPIRRIVRNLACADKSGGNQLYAFEVNFTRPKDGNGGDQVIALLSK